MAEHSAHSPRNCPLTQKEILDLYFMTSRAKVLDVAAFLDRLERSANPNAEEDFRLKGLRKVLQTLAGSGSERVEKIQMLLSDTDLSLLPDRDQQSAHGAAKPRR